MRSVSWGKPLRLLLVVSYVALVKCKDGSAIGNECNMGSERLDLPVSISSDSIDQAGGVFLNQIGSASTNSCVTGLWYCYAPMENATLTSCNVSMTIALFRSSKDGIDEFEMVNNSRCNVTTPPPSNFSCKTQSLERSCWVSVMKGDAVGWVISPDVRLVGVTALVDNCDGDMTETTLDPPPSSATSGPSSPTPTPELWVIVTFCVLGVVIMVLLVIISIISIRQCCLCRRTSLSSGLLLSNTMGMYSPTNTALSNGSSAADFAMHVLNTNPSNSTHSTSLSPTPILPQGTQSNGSSAAVITSPLQNPLPEDQGTPSPPPPTAPTARAPLSTKRKPPPVKPKPFNLSSIKAVSQLQPGGQETAPPLTSVKNSLKIPSIATPADNGSSNETGREPLCRSFSEDTLEVHTQGERQNPGASASPQHDEMNPMSAGSLPNFFPSSPVKDEDDYTLPTHPFPSRLRRLVRPQPYLKFQPIYSYAYTHLPGAVAGPALTVPRKAEGLGGAAAVKQRSQSETTYPHDSTLTPPPNTAYYDNITPDSAESGKQVEVENPRKPCSLSSAQSPSPTMAAGHQVFLYSSSHTRSSSVRQPPLDTFPEDSLLQSTGSEGYVNENESPQLPPAAQDSPLLQSTGSDGYMNDDECPRAPPAGSPSPKIPTLKHRYTTLQPVPQNNPTYTALRSSSSSPDPGGSTGRTSTDYDHLHQ